MKKIRKWFHRWVLDSWIEKPPPLACILLCVFVSVFSIGFWCAHWIDEVNFSKYSKLYDVFSDNIGGYAGLNSMRNLLPIDVVYTWVNGSDPLVTKNLKKYMNFEISSCSNVDCFSSSYYTIELGSEDEEDDNDDLHKNANYIQSFRVKKVNIAKNFAVFLKKDDIHEDDFIAQLKALKLNSSIEQAYWTTDSKMDWSITWKKGMIARLDSNMEIHVEVSNISPKNYIEFSEKCTSTKHFGLLLVECTDESLVKKIFDDYDNSVLKNKLKYPKFWEARLILRSDVSAKELDSSRFEDNEELRYSLRSLEKFAPWVRKIFLVTNGQIPSWLNLDHPRLSIITHDQIFPDLSHLPTFSSPAIEAHIHRIPGLSKYFLYLNDDIILGDTVHPDDFFSPTSGYKVYLSWYIPDCASGCPGTWLGDGYCDQTCNSSACFWDGGDCTKPKDQQMSRDNIYDMEEEEDQFMQESEYCATACSYSWLSDTYCDSACGTRSCGYDAGDCGAKIIKENVHKLQIDMNSPKDKVLAVPKGELSAWMDIKPMMNVDQNDTLKGTYSNSKGIAVGTFNVPLGILIFVFKPNASGITEVEFNITNKIEDNVKRIHFHLQYNTIPFKKIPMHEEQHEPRINDTSDIHNYLFDILKPKPLNETFPLIEYFLSDNTQLDKESKAKQLHNRYKLGELTDKGYKLMKQNLNGNQSYSKTNVKKGFDNRLLLDEMKQGLADIGSNFEDRKLRLVNIEDSIERKQELDDHGLHDKINQDINENEDHLDKYLGQVDKNDWNKNNQGFINKDNDLEKVENDVLNKESLLIKMKEKKNLVDYENLKKNRQGDIKDRDDLRYDDKDKKYDNDNKPKVRDKEYYMNKMQDLMKNNSNSNTNKKVSLDKENHFREKQKLVNNKNILKSNQALGEKKQDQVHNGSKPIKRTQQSLNNEEAYVHKRQFISDNLNKKEAIGEANIDMNKNIPAHETIYLDKNLTRIISNRKLMNVEDHASNMLLLGKTKPPNNLSGSFPWEKRSTSLSISDHEEPVFSTGRKLLDKYKDSLIFVNQLYNLEYGFQARKVPAHMPHFIDKDILEEVQNKFSHEYEVTSSHKIREGNDMQFAFSYFYYLLSEKKRKSIDEIFDDFDTDLSGTWSDREIRSLLTKLNDLPLQFKYFVDIHNDIKNCSEIVKPNTVPTPPYERYADSDVPTVSKELVVKCSNSNLWKKLEKLKKVQRFPHTILSDSVVHFKMITSNVSRVVHHLDDIRKNSRKFVCLNNNMDSESKENDLVRALMQDTYESLFPVPSSFELPLNYRNRFTYMSQLNEWKRIKYIIRSLIYAFLSCLIVLTLTAFFSSEIEALKKRWLKRGRRRREERLIERI